MRNYERATAVFADQKQRLVAIADALLAREVLDADQVRRLAYGQPLDEISRRSRLRRLATASTRGGRKSAHRSSRSPSH